MRSDMRPPRTMWDLLSWRADATPDAVMFYEGDRVVTFADLRDLVRGAASGLHELGIGAGTRVAWQLPTWTESAVLVGALCRLGAVQIPMLPLYREREVGFITQQTACDWLVTPSTWNGFDYAALAETVAGQQDALRVLTVDRALPAGDALIDTEPAPPRSADDVRWIFYTSGTTADPKGAQHTDASVIAGGAGYSAQVGIVDTDTSLVSFPFTHIGGVVVGLATTFLTGSSAVLIEHWSAAGTTELIERHGVTIANGAPAIHSAMLAEAQARPEAYRTVRSFPSGGSGKPPHLHDALRAAVPTSVGILSGYGMTEAPVFCQTTRDAPESSKRNAEGTPAPGVELRFLDREGNVVAHGDEGEVAMRGPQMMRGYLDASLDADAFTSDGFLRTGDLARLDEFGAVVITGRVKDVIIRKGENISAKEVEDVLFTHRNVADVAVLGVPDAERGELVVAVVVAADASAPPTLRDLTLHCEQAGLMRQKFPEHIEVVDALPRNTIGKVLKHELRATLQPGS